MCKSISVNICRKFMLVINKLIHDADVFCRVRI